MKNWAEEVENCQSSGLSVSAWCKLHGIKVKTYYYHLRRVRESMLVESKVVSLDMKNIADMYDVIKLYDLSEIKRFLDDKEEFKRLIRLTKDTDSYYLEKRKKNQDYDPTGAYDFENRMHYLTTQSRSAYEQLHTDLLYTDEKQRFDDAIKVFAEINALFKSLGE